MPHSYNIILTLLHQRVPSTFLSPWTWAEIFKLTPSINLVEGKVIKGDKILSGSLFLGTHNLGVLGQYVRSLPPWSCHAVEIMWIYYRELEKDAQGPNCFSAQDVWVFPDQIHDMWVKKAETELHSWASSEILTHENHEINDYCYFEPLNLGVILYTQSLWLKLLGRAKGTTVKPLRAGAPYEIL